VAAATSPSADLLIVSRDGFGADADHRFVAKGFVRGAGSLTIAFVGKPSPNRRRAHERSSANSIVSRGMHDLGSG